MLLLLPTITAAWWYEQLLSRENNICLTKWDFQITCSKLPHKVVLLYPMKTSFCWRQEEVRDFTSLLYIEPLKVISVFPWIIFQINIVVPIAMLLAAVYLVVAPITTDPQGSLIALGIILAGLPFYWLFVVSDRAPKCLLNAAGKSLKVKYYSQNEPTAYPKSTVSHLALCCTQPEGKFDTVFTQTRRRKIDKEFVFGFHTRTTWRFDQANQKLC